MERWRQKEGERVGCEGQQSLLQNLTGQKRLGHICRQRSEVRREGDIKDGREEGQRLRKTEGKKGRLQTEVGCTMVERRILSSRSGHGGHTGSQERSAKTPKPSISISEIAWLSAGSPGGCRRKGYGVDGKVSRAHRVKE